MATAKKTAKSYVRLDPETIQEIVDCVKKSLREEETKILQKRNDNKRANIKLLLRKYREIVEHVENAVYDATQAVDDYSLAELFEMMGGKPESFKLENMVKNVAGARLLVDHMNKMLERYRLLCESSEKEEDMRRYRVIYNYFIAPERKNIDDLADEEYCDKSTIYRDIDAGANRLAVLFFGLQGLKFL